MDRIDLGPEWFWKLVFILAVCGFFGGLYLFIKGVIWLIQHVQII